MGKIGSSMAFSWSHSSSGISTLGSTRDQFVGIFMYQSISALLYLGKSTASGNPWFPPPTLDPLVLSKVWQNMSQVNSHFKFWLHLVGLRLLGFPHCQHVGRHFLSVSYCKRSHQGCFYRLGTHRSPIAAFYPWLLRDMVVEMRVLFLNLPGTGRDNSIIYNQG